MHSPDNVRIVAFGELLWDMLPSGKKLGGAPVNFLYHARTLGAEIRALTRIGNDDLGCEIQERLSSLDVSMEMIQIAPQAPTGTVAVTLNAAGNPSYEIVENVAWDEIEVNDKVKNAVLSFLQNGNVSAFYFGSLALRTSANREAVQKILDVLPDEVLKVCDLNLRPPFYNREVIEFALKNADVFKLNDVEALVLDQLFNDVEPSSLQSLADSDASLASALSSDWEKTGETLSRWAVNWQKRFNLKTIVLTCGANGAFLFNGSESAYSKSFPVTVRDAVGAGDSFAAVCVVGLLKSAPIDKIIMAASKRASFVCSQDGGTPNVPESEKIVW